MAKVMWQHWGFYLPDLGYSSVKRDRILEEVWKDIGLSEWLFDSDTKFDMEELIPTVLWIANNPEKAKAKALEAKRFVEKRQVLTMKVLANTLKN